MHACDHDLIIIHLAAVLSRWKFKIGNDANMELFLMPPASDSVSHIFAACADGSEKNVLAAAAKLLLQKSARDGNPLAILVMPEAEVTKYAQPLRRISVEVLGYRTEGEKSFS